MKKLFKSMRGYEWFKDVKLTQAKQIILFKYHDRKLCLYHLPSGQLQLIDFESADVTLAFYDSMDITIYDLLTDINYKMGGHV